MLSIAFLRINFLPYLIEALVTSFDFSIVVLATSFDFYIVVLATSFDFSMAVFAVLLILSSIFFITFYCNKYQSLIKIFQIKICT